MVVFDVLTSTAVAAHSPTVVMLPRPRANPVAVAIATAAVLLCVVAVLPGRAEAQPPPVSGATIDIDTPYAGDTILSGSIDAGNAEWRVQLFTGDLNGPNILLAVTIASLNTWTITLPAASALQLGQTIWVTTTGLSGTAVEGVSSTYTVVTRPITFSPLPMVDDTTISGTTTGGAGVEIRLSINNQATPTTTTTTAGGSWAFTGLTDLVDGDIIDVEFTDGIVFSNTVTVQPPSIAFARTPFVGQSAVKLVVNAAAVATGGMTVSGYFSPDNFATTSFLFCAPASAITDSTAITAPTSPQTAGRLFVALYNGACDGLTYATVASASIDFSIAPLDYAPNVGFLGGVPQPGASTFTARVTRSSPNSLAALPFMVATTVNGELVSFGCTSMNEGGQFDRVVNLPSQLADGDVLAVFVDQGLCPSTIPADAVTILTRTISTPAPTIAIDRVPFIGMSTIRFRVTNAVSSQTVRVYSRDAIEGNPELSCQLATAVAVASSTSLSSPIPSDGVFIVVTATACDADPPLAMAAAAAPGTVLVSSTQSAPYSRPVVTFEGFPSATQVGIGIDNSGIRPLSLASSSLIVKAATGDGGYACVSPPVGVPSTNTVAFSSPALGPGGGMHAFWTVGSCPSTPPSLSVLQASDPVYAIDFAYPFPAPTITITGAPVAGATTVSGTVTNAAAGSSVVLSHSVGSGTVAVGGGTWTITLSRRLEGGESLTATVTAAAPNGQTATSAPVVVGMYTAGYRVATATGGVMMTAEQLPGGPYTFQSTMTGVVQGEATHSVFFYSQRLGGVGALLRKLSSGWTTHSFSLSQTGQANFANNGGIDIGEFGLMTFTSDGKACTVTLPATGPGAVACDTVSSFAPGSSLDINAKMRVLDGGGDIANNALVDTDKCGIWVITGYTVENGLVFSRLSSNSALHCGTSAAGLPQPGATALFSAGSSWFGKIFRATMRVRGVDTQVFVQTEAAPETLYLLTIFGGRIGTDPTTTPTVRAVAPMFSGAGAFAGGISGLAKALFVSNQFAVPTVLADLALSVSAPGMVSGVSSPSSMFSTRGGVPIPAFAVGSAASFIETIHGTGQDLTTSPRRLTETTLVAFVQGGAIYTAPFSAITDALQYNPCDASVNPAVCSSIAQNSASVGGGAQIGASTCDFDLDNPTNPAPCVCPALTTGDGSALSLSPCVDIDECATNNGGCAYTDDTVRDADDASVALPDLECTNNGGVPQTCSSTSTHFARVAGTTDLFQDVNECADDNGGCGPDTTSTCTNPIGATRVCGCSTGYARASAGSPCVDRNDCTVVAIADAPAGTSCLDVAAPREGVTYPCLPGYESDGPDTQTCTACVLGHFLDATTGACTPCGADANDATVTTDTEASADRAACKCALGHYFDGSANDAPWAVPGASCTRVADNEAFWSPGGQVAAADRGACIANSHVRYGYASSSGLPTGRRLAGTSAAPEFDGTVNDCLCDLDYITTFTAGVLTDCTACGQGERTLVAFGALECSPCTDNYEYVESEALDTVTDAPAGPIRACKSCDTRSNVAPPVLGENYVNGPYTGEGGCVAGCVASGSATNIFHSTIVAPATEAHCIDLDKTPCAFGDITGGISPCWKHDGTLGDTIFATCSATLVSPFHVCVCPAGFVADENNADLCRALAKNEWRKLDPVQDGIAVAQVCQTGTDTATSSADRFVSDAANVCVCDASSGFYGGGSVSHGGCSSCSTNGYSVRPGDMGNPGATVCAPCDNGFYFDGSCQQCDVDHYCIGGFKFSCPGESTTNGLDTQSTCVCKAGFSSTGAGSSLACTACVAGTFKDSAGNAACTPCTAGKENGGATTSCDTSCTQNSFCPAGLPPQHCPDSDLTDGIIDGTTATDGSDDVTDCKCIAGYKQVTADGATTCVQCPAGKFGTDGVGCGACTGAMYNPTAGATMCETCDAGWVTSKAAGASADEGNVACTACHGDSTAIDNVCTCNAGHYDESASSCAPCPVGKFKTGTGNTPCADCDGGTTGAEGRDATCTELCPANSYCAAGEPPVVCPLSGAADGTSNEGSDAIEDCTCDPGYELNTVDGACDACPAGSVGDGATPCTACTGNEYADGAATNACGTCADGEIAVFDDSGNLANSVDGDGTTGNTQCYACVSPLAPTLSFASGSRSCALCPYLEYRNPTTGECVECPYTVGAAAGGSDGAVRITNDGDASGGATEVTCPTPNPAVYACGAVDTKNTPSDLDDDSYACTLKLFCPINGAIASNTLVCPSGITCDGSGTPHVCNCPAGYAFVAPGDGGVARCSLAPSNAQQGTPATLTLTGTALTAATDNTPIEVGGPPSDPPANPPVQVVIQLPAGPTATPVSPIRICATRSDLVVTVSADANPAGSSFSDNTGAGAATTPLFEFSTASGCVVPQEVRITGVDMGNRGTQPLVAVGAGTPLPKLVLDTVIGTLGNQPFSGVQHVFLDGCQLGGVFSVGAGGGTRRRSVAPSHVINVAGAAKAATSNALAAEE